MSNKRVLIIVESPGKIKTIQKYLGPLYKVLASVGHILDLPSKTMSVDTKHNFQPTYKPIPRQRKVIQQLKAESKKAKMVLLAGDQDREGQFINYSLAYVLGLKNPKQIVYNSITKEALLKAVKNPIDIDYNQVNAQKARRILDRIVGYELGKGKREGTLGKFLMEDEEGIRFGCPPGKGYNYEDMRDLLENIHDYIGQIATFTYFGRTKARSYRHPLFKALRNYE